MLEGRKYQRENGLASRTRWIRKREFLLSPLTSPVQIQHRDLSSKLPFQGNAVCLFSAVLIFLGNIITTFCKVKFLYQVTTKELYPLSLYRIPTLII